MTTISLNPTTDHRYRDFICAHQLATIFHTPEWIQVLAETYGFRPVAYAITDNDKISGVVPFCETRSITGIKRMVSLPYSDFCEPLLSNRENVQSILKLIAAEHPKIAYIDFRGGYLLFNGENVRQTILTHDIDCTSDKEALFNSLKPALRRNINKAERGGLVCSVDTSLEAVQHFYQINCNTRRDHGLPPQPRLLFENIWKFIINRGNGFVTTVTLNGNIIAATLFLLFREKAYFKFGASLEKFLSLRPNDFALWRSILHCKDLGYKAINLGRTELNHEGLLKFKRGWNAQEAEIKYYRYLSTTQSFACFKRPILSTIYPMIFSRMPMALLKPIGNYIHQFAG